ncbi:MAG: type II toxin-antitoxin system VapC family toxin [Acidobacteriota bacterium]
MDTSSLIKLYLDEEHSALVHSWVDSAEILCTSRVAYPEAMAALARRRRVGDLDDDSFRVIRDAVSGEWAGFSTIDLNEQRAGELAVRLGLRGFDAVHLAAAHEVAEVEGTSVFFSSFDKQLNRIARADGLAVLDAESDL